MRYSNAEIVLRALLQGIEVEVGSFILCSSKEGFVGIPLERNGESLIGGSDCFTLNWFIEETGKMSSDEIFNICMDLSVKNAED